MLLTEMVSACREKKTQHAKCRVFLGAFTQSGKNDHPFHHFHLYVRLSLRMYQHGFRWDGFLQNLMLEAFIKICQENSYWVKIGQK
jgi:hypothetical protein